MTTTEMRELDVWIAENVMDWTSVSKPEKNGPQPSGMPPMEAGYHVIKKYTTDPTAAMMVLEKCCDETVCVEIEKTAKGDWLCGEPHGRAFIANTLPIAICQFAKKLFEKGDK